MADDYSLAETAAEPVVPKKRVAFKLDGAFDTGPAPTTGNGRGGRHFPLDDDPVPPQVAPPLLIRSAVSRTRSALSKRPAFH